MHRRLIIADGDHAIRTSRPARRGRGPRGDRGGPADGLYYGATLAREYAWNSGRIVGGSRLAGSQAQHAFISDGATITDLGTLWGSSGEATVVNDNGRIVGSAGGPDWKSHAFLYKDGKPTPDGLPLPAAPVPEPTTLGFAGLIAVGVAVRTLLRRAGVSRSRTP